MPRKTWWIIIALMLLSLPLVAFAQNDEIPVTVGETVTGELVTDAPWALYAIEAQAGDTLDITLTSEAFDSFLTLIGPDGDVLITDDDGAGDSNARIAEFELPESGTYIIRVDSYNQLSTGEYTLLVEGDVSPPPEVTPEPTAAPTDAPPVSTGGTIGIGETVEGSVDASTGALEYTFDGTLGTVVTIELTSPDFDAYLTLQGADGTLLTSDDDSAGNLNARIEDFPLPIDGTYTVTVSSYGGGAAGSFSLSVTADDGEAPTAEPSGEPTAEPSLEPTAESPGVMASFSGRLTDEQLSALYEFEGRAGDVISFTMTSDDFDAYLTLQGPNGRTVIEDDDSGGGRNASIDNYTLLESGTYTLIASSNTRTRTGSFVLNITGTSLVLTGIGEQPTPEPTAIAQSGGEVELNSLVNGALTPESATATYTFTTSGAEIVMITVTSSIFDPFVTLLDANGDELASDDDSAGSLNARISDFQLPGAGTYTVVVSSATGATSGEFTLSINTAQIQPTAEPTVEPTSLPPGSSITLGDSISGFLDGDEPIHYTFEGESGQAVTITLTSDDFDAYLRLLDADGDELDTDDDSAGNLNARIENFTLPANGTYTIEVDRFDDGVTGEFVLSLTSGGAIEPTVEPTSVPGGSEIAIGGSVTSELEPGQDSTIYTFEGEAGQLITINLSSDDFDAYVTLNDPSGFYLTSDDDSGGGLDSRIAVFTLPENGTYSIVVESFDGESGQFTLSLSTPTIENIAYGDSLSGSITAESSSIIYLFDGSEGDVITISLTSPDFDTYLTLATTGDGFPLVENDDGGGGTDSHIGPYTLPSTGEYVITVSSYSSDVSGAYTVSLNEAELSTIAYGDTVEATFDDETRAVYYSFEAALGDIIDVSVDGDIDTTLVITGPGGYEVFFDEDGGARFNPEANRLILNQEGTYIIQLNTALRGERGTVSLTLSQGEVRTLDDGPQEVRLAESISQDVLTFEGNAGETVQLVTRVVSGAETSSPSITVTQGEATLATGSGSDVTNLIIEFTVPEDGTVTVQIYDYSFTALVLEVSVERQ
ncbi:MAG: pre-peptidase C-terminal domain-containing protein [Anaerolineae bacterium]|nr:pre-peptidase C-terminal domain-containing protein [Anaerolineae bacterium]